MEYFIESITQTLCDNILEINFFNHETILVSIDAAVDLLDHANSISQQVIDMIQSYNYNRTSVYI